MIHTQKGLRLFKKRSGSQILAILLLTAAATRAAGADWDREGAKRAWEEATQQREALAQLPQPARDAYIKCIRTYQLVYTRDPHFSSSGDAVYQAAKLYAELGEKLGAASDYKNAARLYEFFVKDYDGHYLCPDALLRLGKIYEGPLSDAEAAAATFEKLRTRYKWSPEAKSVREVGVPPVQKPVQPKETPANQAQKPAPPTPAVEPPSAGSVAGGVSVPPTHPVVKLVKAVSGKDSTQINIDLDSAARYLEGRLPNPDRVYFDIANSTLDPNMSERVIAVDDPYVKQVRIAQNQPNVVRVVVELSSPSDYTVSQLMGLNRIVVDIHSKAAAGARPGSNPIPPAAVPPAQKTSPVSPALQSPPAAPQSAAQKNPGGGLTAQPANATRKPSDLTSAQTTAAGAGVQSKSAAPIQEPVKRQPSATQATGAESKSTATTVSPAKVEAQGASANPSAAAKPPEKEGPPQPGRASVTSPPAATATAKETTPPNTPPPPVVPNMPPQPRAALPTGKGDRTLTRTLGLKIGRIVLDPGHGGSDEGTIGPGGSLEKDLVLQIAKELQKLLVDNLAADVILTRTDDSFVSLEERTAIANREQADLFVSIHLNSSPSHSTSGVETYFLDFAHSDASREVASRENATNDKNARDLQELIAKIAQAEKINESQELAANIQRNLLTAERKMLPASQDRGVRSAPFIVLIGAHMPSVLVEVAFLSNPRDEKLLGKDTSQQSLAAALFRGIEAYIRTLGSGVAQNSNTQIK